MKKYKLTSESKINAWGVKLFRIEALVAFGNVEKGEKGGWIQAEANLELEIGNAWVYGNAEVFGNAWVYGDARVSGDAWVYGNAWVFGKLKITLGCFFGYRKKDETLTYFDIDDEYQLIGKGECKQGDDNDEKKQELLNKAQELIEKANELKEQAEEL